MCVHIFKPLKADHPERPTITLGPSLEHVRGILENDILLFDLMVGAASASGCEGAPLVRNSVDCLLMSLRFVCKS